ncbi:MAG: hypothetical protein RJA71_642, partial [Actinomycetota bacterium]
KLDLPKSTVSVLASQFDSRQLELGRHSSQEIAPPKVLTCEKDSVIAFQTYPTT